ncbi:MAG: hypothetical protein K2I30_04800 [Clostridia bacterium]|nr:hypothetical protein [Clostridia bacterium]
MSETKKVCSCFGHFTVEITDKLKARTREEMIKQLQTGFGFFCLAAEVILTILSMTQCRAKKHKIRNWA